MRKREKGGALTEYIIIVGLIAIVLITAVSAFGNKMSSLFKTGETKLTDIETKMNGKG